VLRREYERLPLTIARPGQLEHQQKTFRQSQLVERLTFGKHCQDHAHALLPRLWFFGGLQTVGNCVEVGFVQGCEEGGGLFIFSQRGQKVVGNGGFARGIVSGGPSAVLFRGIDFGVAWRLHAARSNKSFGVLRVDFGPAAFGTPRCEFLQPRSVVMALFLAVDPSKAKRLVERSGVSNGGLFRVFLANAKPDAGGLAMIRGEPFAKVRGRLKAKDF
jgi:hypothetical protein